MTGDRPKDPLLPQYAHRRWNPLTGDWVLVSPQRIQRPWQGAVDPVVAPALQSYDSECYLCPGNVRANGERNPRYTSTFIFPNDFPALTAETDARDNSAGRSLAATPHHPLLTAEAQAGECRVLCYSPRHDLSLAELPVAGVRAVIDAWCAQTLELERKWRWVQVFENRGEQMGASNPHPHGQIWAGDAVPSEVERELEQQQLWHVERGIPLLQEYAELESARGERVVIASAHWLALVPWWAAWPFEILLLPRRAVQHLPDLTDAERQDLATVLAELLASYDRLFDCLFPYSFGWHSAPSGASSNTAARVAPDAAGCQLHAHFYPPLLRSATVRKFMVGYELLAEIQRDLTPEQAASLLRESGSNR